MTKKPTSMSVSRKASEGAAAPDPNKAKTAFHNTSGRAKALRAEELLPTNLNVHAAAIVALGVAQHTTAAPVRRLFELLPRELFDISHLDDLETLALACWHAANELEALKASESRAKLPADLVEQARQLESRMQRCCEYHLGDDPVYGPKLAVLRAGSGYGDLASDLAGYAEIEQAHHELLNGDRKYYRATDAADALRLSMQILRLLGEAMTKEQKAAGDDLQRRWTLLSRGYEEVAVTGRWLERSNPAVDRLYPSLIAVSRRPSKRAGEGKTEPAGGATG